MDVFGIITGIATLLGVGIQSKELLTKSNKINPNKFFKEINNIVLQHFSNDKEISKHLITEKLNGEEVLLPVIKLIDSSISIHKNISQQKDNNSINYEFIESLIQQGKNLYNGKTYRLVDLSMNNTASIGLSSYYQTLSTCDIYYYKLIEMYQKNKFDGKVVLEWLEKLKDIVINKNFNSISASLGVSTLLVIKVKNRYKYYIADSSNKKNGNNTRHVIPSFMYQPTKSANNEELKKQLDLEFQVLKEFGEELLNLKKLEDEHLHDALKIKMKKTPLLKKLKKLINDETNNVHFKILGMGLDIFRLRPEILTLLFIDDKSFNESFLNEIEESHWEIEKISDYDIFDEEAYKNLLLDREKPLVSPAFACLKLGRDYVINNILQKGSTCN